MPNRDYVARSKSKKGVNKLLILIIIILLLLLSGLGLLLLQDKAPEVKPVNIKPVIAHKNELPSKPQEIYSYIRDLETREVPVDKNSKLVQLTKEQEKQILLKQKAEKLKLEQQAIAQSKTVSTSVEDEELLAVNAQTENSTGQLVEEKTQQEKKIIEERKQAELKKKELAKKAEQEKQKAQTKIVATAKPSSEAPKSVGKYGLQCGAFKSKSQAENMQARLAMAGYNARINSSAEWNRVIVGPIGDRAAASAAQSNARSVAECLIVGM